MLHKRKITYKDFEAGIFVMAIFPKRNNITGKKAVLLSIVNVHKTNGKVRAVYLKEVGVIKKNSYIMKAIHNPITKHIENPKEYFQRMTLKLVQ